MNTLLRICALPPQHFAEVTVTSDGYYMARTHGDIGFNAFLGKPNPRPQPSTTALAWKAWDALEGYHAKRQLVQLARTRGVNLRHFLRPNVA